MVWSERQALDGFHPARPCRTVGKVDRESALSGYQHDCAKERENGDDSGKLLSKIHVIGGRLPLLTTASQTWCGFFLKLLSEIGYTKTQGIPKYDKFRRTNQLPAYADIDVVAGRVLARNQAAFLKSEQLLHREAAAFQPSLHSERDVGQRPEFI